MKLASLIQEYLPDCRAKYGARLSSSQEMALNAILNCRTLQAGAIQLGCTGCDHTEWRPRSCGNRNCPQCQNHEATEWLERQQAKLLPVEYFLVTFTLPYELRSLVYDHQLVCYRLFFDCVVKTLKSFGLNSKHLGAELGMTAVLHTHSRRLEYHPHIHVVVPAGGIDRVRRQWKKKKGKYLFPEAALASVFRGKYTQALYEADLMVPAALPKKWVVDCSHVGKGMPALKYLSKYLYRGVLSERNIVSNQDGYVTFRYTESGTGETKYRKMKGEDFLWKILQHVLPKGFRRVRDYGFLHGNAKAMLDLVQMILKVIIPDFNAAPRPQFHCPHCRSPMIFLGVRTAWESG